MTNKQFAEMNAGKYFACPGGYKARVVGYLKRNDRSIIVSVPKTKAHNIGWSKMFIDEYDILVTPSRATRFLYVDIAELMRWK